LQGVWGGKVKGRGGVKTATNWDEMKNQEKRTKENEKDFAGGPIIA